MLKIYNSRLLIVFICFGMFVYSLAVSFASESINENINVSTEMEDENFTYLVSSSIYYPEDEILYLYYSQTLINQIYIGEGNDVKVYYNYNTDSEKVIHESSAEQGLNTILIDLTSEEYANLETLSVQVYDKEIETRIFSSVEYVENIVVYDSLGNYAITPKTKEEKIREINYFKYLYENDPLWEITELDKVGVDESFKGNIKSQHQFLVELLDEEAYTEAKNDEVMEYFKEAINKDLYKDYQNADTLSEKQAVYLVAIDEMITSLEYSIGVFEDNLTTFKYLSEEEIETNTAGMNILQKYKYLKEKNDKLFRDYDVEEIINE